MARVSVLVLPCAALLALSACGGDTETSTDSPAPASSTPATGGGEAKVGALEKRIAELEERERTARERAQERRARDRRQQRARRRREREAAQSASSGIVVPDVVGKDHQLAQDTMQAAGLYLLDEQDASGEGRLLLWDRNWYVVDQKPAAGREVDEDTTITLYALKDGE